jgi:hypothetical protein
VFESSDDEEENQVIYVKKASKATKAKVKSKNPKRKQIIVYQDADSDSSSSSDSESDNEPAHFKSQRNKKSLMKVYSKPQSYISKPIQPTKNYFAD